MKGVKIVIVSLIAIALMVTPIALFAVDNTESEAANYQELSDILDNIDFEKLMSLDYSKPTLADDRNVTDDIPVAGNSYLYLDKDFKFTDGKKIVVASGGALTICPTQTFSFSSTGWGGIVFEAHTSIYITTDGNEPTEDTPFTDGNIITEIPIEEATTVWFTGSFGYQMKGYEFVFTASEGTVISDSNVAASQNGTITFNKDNSLDLKIVMASTSGGKSTIEVTVTSASDVTASMKVVEEPATATEPAKMKTVVSTVTGSTEYKVNMEQVKSATQTDYKFTLKGNNEMDMVLDEKYGGSIKDSADFTITATAYADETKDPVTTMSGSLSLEISTKNMDKYQAQPGMTITVKDAKAKYSLDFNNDTVTGKVDAKLGTYEITVEDESGTVTTSMKDLKAYGKYEGKFSFNGLDDLTVSPAQSLKTPSYYDGLVPGMSSSEVKAYASEYFLSSFDKSAGLDQSGLTTTGLDIEISVGKADMNGVTVSGMTADLEINESVGFSATASVDSLIVQPNSVKQMTKNTKLVLGSSKVTVNTDTNGRAMFIVDFNGSGQVKQYQNGVVLTDMYAKDVKGKIINGKSGNTIDSFSMGEVALGTYGVYLKASNVSYDKDWEAFVIDEVTLSGDYYGTAPVKSVEGKYKSVIYDPDTKATVTLSARSANIRVYALNDDYMDFTRTYDSEKKVITNTYKVEGQIFMPDILKNDNGISNLLLVPISGAVNAKEVNYFEGGAIVSAGYAYEPEQGSPVYYPGVTVSNKSLETYYPSKKLAAPSQVFMSNYDLNGKIINTSKGAIKINDVTTTVSLKGAALGVAMDADGVVSYSLAALPGYTLSNTMEKTGMTLTDLTETSAKVTLTGDPISCTAVPIKYNIKLDGNVVKEGIDYGSYVTINNAFADDKTLYVVDGNGRTIGYVSDTDWVVGNYLYAKDLDVQSVKGKTVTTFEPEGTVNVVNDASSVKFTVPAGQSEMKFSLSSKVRFDLSGLSANDNIELVAEPTKYNGNDAFIIKATNDGLVLGSTLFIPVSGDGKRLMHVDEYGRVTEVEATLVTIDDQNYMKAEVDNYSIFYAESDDSPVLPSSGSGTNWLLIGIGIAAAVLIIAGVVVFIKKR